MALELRSAPPLYSPPSSSLKDKPSSSSSTSAKLPSSDGVFRRMLSAFVLPSPAVAWLATGPASAISYNDLPLSVSSVQAPTDVDISSITDSVTSFAVENPLAIFAGLAAVAIPLVVSNLFSEAKPWSSISAKDALVKLEVEDVQLLDIRSSEDIKAEGTPDLRSVKKRVFQIPYIAGDDEAYLKKLLAKFKNPPETTLCILDQFDGNALSVAKFVTTNGFKAAYAIKDGAEGPNGWRNSNLPWILPRKGFTLDISSLKDVIDSTFNENPNLVPATLGVAAAAGVSFVVLSEAETALQLLGSAALVQLFVRKFLFAKDRQKTLKELQTFLDTKIAPKELVDEIKGISGAILPKYNEVASGGPTNGAAASTESSPAVDVQAEVAVATESTKAEEETKAADLLSEAATTELKGEEPKAVEESQVVPLSEAPKASVTVTDLPRSSSPLSPYTQFPELKPPSPPMPSRP